MRVKRDGKLRYIFFGAAAVLGILVTLLGGGIFTSFGVLFTLGFILGWQGKKTKQFFDDYRLGLRINALQYSARVMEEKERERQALLEENRQLLDRLRAQDLLKEGNVS